MCPVQAIGKNPVSIDLGKCSLCGECAIAFPEKIRFTNDHKISTNVRERLVIKQDDDRPITHDSDKIRKVIREIFSRSLKLRQVSAAVDNSNEFKLNACGNANFDMGRFGIEFVASPRHADGVVITGPISESMAEPLKICYTAIPEPQLTILVGNDAISGGIFAGSPALNRSFLDAIAVDLYVPGNPVHPLTFVNGVLELTRSKFWRR